MWLVDSKQTGKFYSLTFDLYGIISVPQLPYFFLITLAE